ncbi:hypothetical protein EMM73_05640 [Rheinheimera sediminis]|uniref:hypothetical protein n=1 Tax=Rheinheimera sp. YQF-1 TaxID=2499626 RepID=UPI000FDC51FC|nr:hypothetical protein [Rheinheimera sp. YQF-1]RVT47381.1 hypothetical protein EMM73_05640 [Rheinheimera sp. YQF-1]
MSKAISHKTDLFLTLLILVLFIASDLACFYYFVPDESYSRAFTIKILILISVMSLDKLHSTDSNNPNDDAYFYQIPVFAFCVWIIIVSILIAGQLSIWLFLVALVSLLFLFFIFLSLDKDFQVISKSYSHCYFRLIKLAIRAMFYALLCFVLYLIFNFGGDWPLKFMLF